MLAWRRTNFDFINYYHTLGKTFSNLNIEHLRYLTVDLDDLWDAQAPNSRDPGHQVFGQNCDLHVILLIANARAHERSVRHSFPRWAQIWPTLVVVEQFALQLPMCWKFRLSETEWEEEKKHFVNTWQSLSIQDSLECNRELITVVAEDKETSRGTGE